MARLIILFFIGLMSSGFVFAQSDPTASDGVDNLITVAPVNSSSVNLSYDQAVAEGLQNNLNLLAAKYNIPMAEANELTAGLWNNPSLLADTIFEPFGHNWDQTSAGGPRQFDFGLSYPVDVSGAIPAAHKSAHEATNIAKLTFQDTMRQTLLAIRLAYINVTTAQAQMALCKEEEDSLTDLLGIIKNRIGDSRLPLEVLRAQLGLDQARLNRRQAAITLRAARAALAVALGRHQETPIETTTALRDFKMPPPPPVDALIAQALNDRPDLQALKVTLKKANLDKNLASAQIWSGVVVTGQYSTQGPVSANPDDPSSSSIPRGNSWDASITIPLPLFNHNQGNIHLADLTYEQTQKQIEALQLSISQTIAGDYDQLVLNRGLVIDYEKGQLDNARKLRDENQKQVGMGNDTMVDYFDALNAYNQIVSAYYNAVGAYRSSVAQLNADCARQVLP